MFARLPATLGCVFSVALCLGRAEPVPPPDRPLVVYLRTNPGQPFQPIQEMKTEVTALLETSGYHVTWRVPGDRKDDAGESSVVVLELRGVCRAPQGMHGTPRIATGTSLASTAVLNGEVLPFSWLECEALSRLLASSISNESEPKQDHLYGRAMGRLVAHELVHFLTNSRGHDSSGIGKLSFSAKDMLREHFEFELDTLARFRSSAPASTEPDEETFEEPVGGR